MGLFKKNTVAPTVTKEKTLAEELASIQSVFRQAHVKATALASKILAKKEATKATIAALNQELDNIVTVEQNTATFVNNLEKFILSE